MVENVPTVATYTQSGVAYAYIRVRSGKVVSTYL